MATKIQMINRKNLVPAEGNHRQEGARKIEGTEWLEGLNPLIVAMVSETMYIVLNGNRRLKYLTGCVSFPCIVVAHDVSTPEGITTGIEKYKGDSLSLSLSDVVRFGLDKVKYNLGKYLAKEGETLFLSDMLRFYEDYHPCPLADETDKETLKKIKGFHKGLNQSVFRASMLGGEYAADYVGKMKGVSTALRAGWKAVQAGMLRELPFSDAKLEAYVPYQEELQQIAKGKAESETVDGIGNYISRFSVTVKENADLPEERKAHYAILLSAIATNNIEAFMREVLK